MALISPYKASLKLYSNAPHNPKVIIAGDNHF